MSFHSSPSPLASPVIRPDFAELTEGKDDTPSPERAATARLGLSPRNSTESVNGTSAEPTISESASVPKLPSTKSDIARDPDSSPQGLNGQSALEESISNDIKKSKNDKKKKNQITAGGAAAAVGAGAGFLALGPIAALAGGVAAAGAGIAYVSRGRSKSSRDNGPEGELSHDKAVTASMTEDQKKRAEFKRPSQKRLKFLTRWAKMEIEDDWEKNIVILDDIVMEFSPWVQEMMIAKALVNKSKSSSNQRKFNTCLLHLAPLYNFLQKVQVFEAFQMLNRRFARKWDSGVYDDNPGPVVKRCTMVLPIVHKSVEALRPRSGDPDTEAGKEGLFRLDSICEWIAMFLARPDVMEFLAEPRRHSQMPGTGPGGALPEATSDDDAKSNDSEFEEDLTEKWPPLNAENEIELEKEQDDPDVHKSKVEDEFLSCDSDDDGGTPEPKGWFSKGKKKNDKRRSSIKRSSIQSVATAVKNNITFSAPPEEDDMILDDSGAPRKHSWQPVDATTFKVRGPNYLQDRVKYESMPAMFECVKGDIFRVDEKVPFLANHPQGFRNRMRAAGDNRMLIIHNMMIPPLQAVLVFALDDHDLCWMRDPEKPETKLWKRWLGLPTTEREYRLKLMARVVDGPWLARKAIANKPIVLGGKFPIQFDEVKDDYVEISCDCLQSSRSAKNIVSVLCGAGSSLVIDCVLVLEGREDDELPERILGGGRFQFPNTSDPPQLLPLAQANEGTQDEC